MNATLRALNGFGLGARPGERQRIGDARAWLRAQLQGNAPVMRAPAEGSPECHCRCASRVSHDRPGRRAAAAGGAAAGAARSRRHRGRRKPCRAHRARDDGAAIRRAPCRVLVESSVRLRRREGARRPCRRQLRTRGDQAARLRPVRRHAARIGEASRDARLPRQLPVDRSRLSWRAVQRTWRRAAARAQRKLRARAARAAHAGSRRRLHATGCAGAREDSHRMDGRRPWTRTSVSR